MTKSLAERAQILGTGSFLPKRRITNSYFESLFDYSESKIKSLTGIRERRWVDSGETASDLAVSASRAALEMSDCPPLSLKAIILSTTSPDMTSFPATACLVQERLCATRAFGFDVAASCGGFLVALSIGKQWLESGKPGCVLIVASEVKSRFLDLQDPTTAILFGDGAGALVLGSGGSGRSILSIILRSDGTRSDLIRLPAGGSRQPLSNSTLSEGLHTLKMKGGAVFRAAVRHLEAITHDVLKNEGVMIDDVRYFIYHQANARILSALARRLSIPEDRMVSTLEYTGNTSSASLPIALDSVVRKNALKSNDLIFMAAFGGGLNWGGALIRW